MARRIRIGAILATLLLPALASGREAEAAEDTVGRFETGDGWGIVEHELRVVPVEEEQPAEALSADLPHRPGPAWPNDHLYGGWDFGTSFAYPQVYPNVGARLLNVVGDVEGATNFVSRLEAELYLLHFGVTFLESIGGDRADGMRGDADLRIPIGLGRHHRLAVMPGVSFPIGEADLGEDTTNVRLQSIYAFGAGGFGLQLRAGVTEGTRPAGVLAVNEIVDGTAALYGALAAVRLADVVQLRAEVAGEIASADGDADRLTLLPGLVFFPYRDPRLHLGLTAVVEMVGEGLDDGADLGGLFDVGVFFH